MHMLAAGEYKQALVRLPLMTENLCDALKWRSLTHSRHTPIVLCIDQKRMEGRESDP
ncbi:hypothetical protein GCM10011403_14710 [Pseudohongiella nitratireducens]|uniref:Uncharacterized protein n=1 Tax=Pseudohongiella nitratireducens TaxID=1768907 RepID=A0A917LV38_9GAMM|nr:hypothetical protein GCM10011403_14710 [Pseudohongiella nitratireducens]